MSWIEKISEKLGIIEEEEYDDGMPETDQLEETRVIRPVGRDDNSESGEIERIPGQSNVFNHVTENNGGNGTSFKEVTMRLRPNDGVQERKTGRSIFGGKKTSGDMGTVAALAQALHLSILEPVVFDDSQKIADCLQNGQPVIINYEETDPVVSKRISDFICGVVYALGGSMKMLGRKTTLCAPRQVDIDAKEDFFEENADQTWVK